MRTHLLIAHACGTLTDTIKLYFTLRGDRVEVVTDGQECIARLQRGYPDAIILDDDLPCGGGGGVLMWMRHEGRRLEIPVMMLTERTRQKEDGPPVTHRLRSPFDIRDLFKAASLALAPDGQTFGGRVREPQNSVYLPVAADGVIAATTD